MNWAVHILLAASLFTRLSHGTAKNLYLLRKDSHKPQTIEEVCDLFDNHPLDHAFIDGDHTCEGVKAYPRNYGPLVRPGGIIAFHDILPRLDLPEIQVHRFWSEVRGKYDTHELIGPEGSGRKIGIGLIRVSESEISD